VIARLLLHGLAFIFRTLELQHIYCESPGNDLCPA
jgi:hypothetical protein